MANHDRIRQVQRLYPRLYFACHASHAREDGLSESELRVLHHIDGRPGTFASELARHLGLSRSRLSEALKGLDQAGLILRETDAGARKRIRLTQRGERALTAEDGLDPESIGAVLDRLEEDEQERVIEGLRLLSRAVGEGSG